MVILQKILCALCVFAVNTTFAYSVREYRCRMVSIIALVEQPSW